MHLLNIKGLDDYIKNGRLSFIANEFYFDEKNNNNVLDITKMSFMVLTKQIMLKN